MHNPIALVLLLILSILATNSSFAKEGSNKKTASSDAKLPSAKTAEQAWHELVGSTPRKQGVFKYVQRDPALPNVLIYGDSISIGYTQPVREQLAGKANVFRLFRNGMESGRFIPLMQQMHNRMRNPQLVDPWSFDWDVIHFNVGLHDVKYSRNGQLDKKSGKQVTSVDDYAKNLEAIIAYLKQFAPDAKLIFATTTPVPKGANGRFAGDAVKYNKVALSVLKLHPEIAINDLYSLCKPNQEKWWSKPADVHYNGKARHKQGAVVAKVIETALAD